MDKVSIITTFFNAEQFLLTAVNSVNLQQTFNQVKIEYILINDKSTDNSLKILIDFLDKNANKDIDFKIIETEENLGCGGARAFGISKATGNYFMFLDADDYYINTDFVFRAYTEMKKTGADIIEYGIIFNQLNGNAINNVSPQRIEITNPIVAELSLFKDNLIKFNVWSKIYKRSIVESYPYSTSRTFEDVRTIPYWIENAKKIIIMPSLEINYRAASQSIIRNDNINTRVGTITAISELFEHFKNYPIILKAMYRRSMVDLEEVLHNHSSKDPGYNEMSKLNRNMLKYLYPNSYKNITYLEGEKIEKNEG